MNAQTIKSNLPNIFLNGLRLSEKSFLLINPVLDSAMGRDFHQLRQNKKNSSRLLTQWQK